MCETIQNMRTTFHSHTYTHTFFFWLNIVIWNCTFIHARIKFRMIFLVLFLLWCFVSRESGNPFSCSLSLSLSVCLSFYSYLPIFVVRSLISCRWKWHANKNNNRNMHVLHWWYVNHDLFRCYRALRDYATYYALTHSKAEYIKGMHKHVE